MENHENESTLEKIKRTMASASDEAIKHVSYVLFLLQKLTGKL